jgi:Uma2 family endonuclease
MGTLLESPPTPISLAEVALISRQLADDVSRLVLKTEGFSVDDYLSLDGPYYVEYVDGCLQVLPMPTALHQAIAFVLANLLIAYSKPDSQARTKLAPFRVKISDREFREPDVCFMLGRHADRRTNQFWIGADLVVEVVSESNRAHDFETKRREYASAGIPEYWIIDPADSTIRIFSLQQSAYVQHGEFGFGQTAASLSLSGFEVDVAELFTQAVAQA